MSAEDFIRAYQAALASQNWALVEPLVHEDACVTFSNGTVHKGKAAVRAAYEANFSAIEDEDYRISNVHWVRRDEDVAVYLFELRGAAVSVDTMRKAGAEELLCWSETDLIGSYS